MSDAPVPVTLGEPPHGWLARVVAGVAGAFSAPQGVRQSAAADELFARYDDHDEVLDREWPGTHPSGGAAERRDRALARREKSLRTVARQTAVSDWIAVLLKLFPVVLAAGVAYRLFGG